MSQKVDYTIRDSVDRIGNLYISFQSQLPSVMTFVNDDGSVTVCSSDETGKTLSEVRELKGIRLNMNDVMRYNSQNGKVYWAINNDSKSVNVYALEIEK